MTEPIITATGLEKTYRLSKHNIVKALRGADVTIGPGELVAIVGPSGGGKSTLMHILGLLDRADAGNLEIDGVNVTRLKGKRANQFRAKKIGFIFQGFNLLPGLTALENVMLAGRYGGQARKERGERALELLTMVGLEGRVHHKPSELSGGQQQRVAIARALMNRPTLILADEPTGELDSETSREIVELMKRLNKENGQTFVLVTHDSEVASACKRTIRLKDGKVVR